MITIIDYEAGNIGSILNMIKRIGGKACISGNADEIRIAEKLILPGVGHFDYGMLQLRKSGLSEALQEAVIRDKKPVLGICLGMQLMTQRSEEGVQPGLGWFNATVKKFQFSDNEVKLKVPHMGWNHVSLVNKNSRLFKDMPEDPRFYFVHSFYASASDPAEVLTTTQHGLEFASSLEKGNIYGVQFHPEKSHKYGIRLLQNFLDI
ncbi:imidazole glycerol phosphate synthase subunit HisH [Chitinophaga alhagiae]|uniref:Imidazole glycerol phosphate synthase subunit HisH n=1 Tax=Chitinophaga alhagiae TaxID=2203219 RepID=A0ABM6WBE7_9BACT|nr:imidazole glycerol phosphate synthase subunit HisH [Chitinophaga alhagiae]AWO01177.1 imidazole glycerol phosphate synthase subunit HisH [Chitinophaga alhagiae]